MTPKFKSDDDRNLFLDYLAYKEQDIVSHGGDTGFDNYLAKKGLSNDQYMLNTVTGILVENYGYIKQDAELKAQSLLEESKKGE